MSPQEKDQLVALLLDAQRWCQGAEARDADGEAVAYTDANATAWDLTGAACHLFGWPRACELFVHIDRHLHGLGVGDGTKHGRSQIAAMIALQSWNDAAQTTHFELLSQLQSLPARAPSAGDPNEPGEQLVPEGIER